MKNSIYIAQSLDGYIAGPNGELDWLEAIDNPDQSDFGFADFMDSVDGLIMGKHTFEKVLSFGVWPYTKPVFVASGSLTSLPAEMEGKAFLLQGTPGEMVKVLHEQDYHNLYIDGGALIQSFLRENLIDELIVTTVPVLLGEGIPLFGQLPKQVQLKLLGSELLVDQLVKTHYRVEKT